MARISPTRFIDLKSKVKTECNRRNNKSCSVTSYGGSDYDFTTIPTIGNKIKEEHYEKNAIPMNAINSLKIPDIEGKNKRIKEEDLSEMESLITSWSATSYYNNKSTDCNGNCTGLCYSCTGECDSGCSGCSGSCTSCSGSCSGDCDGGCSGSCTGNCKTTCSTSCGSNGCSGQCTSSCYSGDCSGSCGSSCANCGNTCSSVSK